jgi:8-oxo-dGTP diphosphatase
VLTSTITAAPARTSWTYTTVTAETDELLRTVRRLESNELRWVAECDVAALRLHPGLAASWPCLRVA